MLEEERAHLAKKRRDKRRGRELGFLDIVFGELKNI